MVKNFPANAGDARDMGSIPGSGRSPGEGMATHSSGAWWATVHGVAESDVTEATSHTHTVCPVPCFSGCI